ncbi:MAG: thioether cross-link-forming SCIFF peptide maturase [Syntrophomonadaceae bacterium]|nr:thioether cross-link-forming SCIFF peptide maturase [Syntrophomonadaceae bacterium]
MFRLAAYDFNANIHIFKYRDLQIVLDVNSGAVHVLDDLAAAFITQVISSRGDIYMAMERCMVNYSQDEVMETVNEIMALMENDSLFSEEEEISLDLTGLPLKALCLNVAHVCNMKCGYCFASQGDFGLNPSLMSLSTGKRALDFLLENCAGVKRLEIDFFGGEPLLNAGMVRDLVLYARELEAQTGKTFNFTLTTNALLLDDEMIDFIIAQGISVVLSLDGRPEVNDRCRTLNNGAGSYDLVLPKIKRIVEKNPVSYYVRGTFTRHNLDFTQDLRHIIDLGFPQLSLEPAIGSAADYAIQAADLPQVLAEYDRLTDTLLEYHQAGQAVHFFHYNLNLQEGPCLAKRRSGCGAGVDYLAVTPEGDIYPCHQLVGNEEFLLGNVEDGNLKEEMRRTFARNDVAHKDECMACWARNFCGGGCHANNYLRKGDIAVPDDISCAMHRKRVEGAIYLDLKKRMQEP